MRKGDHDAFSSAGSAHQANPEAIARRAYELYQQRGSEAGHEIEDWLQAEAELTGNNPGVGDRLDGVPEALSSSETESTSTSTSRKTNGSRRSQRQPHGH
jgi:hypothetical protein